MNIKFEEELQTVVNKAIQAAESLNKNMKVYSYPNGSFEFGETQPSGTRKICEIKPDESFQTHNEIQSETWIQVKEKSWMDTSRFFGFQIVNDLLFARNKDGICEFKCDPEIVIRELTRIGRIGGNIQPLISTNNPTGIRFEVADDNFLKVINSRSELKKFIYKTVQEMTDTIRVKR